MSWKLPRPLELFEQRFVLRVARIAPLVLSGVLALALIVGGTVFLASLIPPSGPDEPDPVQAPELAELTPDEVVAHLNADDTARSRPATQDAPATDESQEPSAAAVRLAREVHAVREALAEQGVAWETRRVTVCTERFYGRCVARERRVQTQGYGEAIVELLTLHDTSDRVEMVRLEDDDATYVLNSSNHRIKIEVLPELPDIIAGEADAGPERLVAGWIELRRLRDAERREALRAERRRVARERQEAEARYEERMAERNTRLTASLAGVGVSLGGLIVLGLLLAVVAIERNTRALRERPEEEPQADREDEPVYA